MMNCKQVAEVLDSDGVKRQRLWTRVEIRIHLWMCGRCSSFARQVAALRRVGQRLARDLGEETPAAGQDAIEERLMRRLQTRLKDRS